MLIFLLVAVLLPVGVATIQCTDGYYPSGSRCYKCYYQCLSCGASGPCTRCPSSCPCTNNCHGNCQLQSCATCIDGYYLTNGYCRKCELPGCNCTTQFNCPTCLLGWYGNNCGNNCLSSCKENLCHEVTGECTNGCSDNYFRDSNNRCISCPSTCNRCSNLNYCTECKDQYHWGQACQFECTGCSNFCSKTGGCTSTCMDGFYQAYSSVQSGYVCVTCPQFCTKCYSASYCNECRQGYWGGQCQNSCSGCVTNGCEKVQGCTRQCNYGYYKVMINGGYVCNNCPSQCVGQCNRNTGTCIVCHSRQYFDLTSGLCKDCPANCKYCESTLQCNECENGRWGSVCDKSCNHNCQGNTCFQANGQCSHGCKPGLYGSFCNSNCLMQCKTCQDGTNCIECKHGYFNAAGSSACECKTEECLQRDASGVCSQCALSTWYISGNGCCPCGNSNCNNSICNTDGTCKACINGKFGRNCYQSCSNYNTLCVKCNGDDWNTFECDECKINYYPDRGDCERCSSKCQQGVLPLCDQATGYCNYGCVGKWYGQRCDLMCPNNCRDDTTCDELVGKCVLGCNDGWTGARCESRCPSTCLSCNQTNETICGICVIGYYGDKCDLNCSQNCKAEGDNPECEQLDGRCLHGCINGHWGSDCTLRCSEGCDINTCEQIKGRCSLGCKEDYYMDTCNTTCSLNCIPNPSSHQTNRTCNETSGICLFGCKLGNYGFTCDNSCSQYCNGSLCERYSGNCAYGCINGYEGTKCTQAKISAIEYTTNIAAVGAGAGAGIALLIAVVVVVIVVLWRRRRNSSTLDKYDSGIVHESPDPRTADSGLVYSSIDDSRIRKAETGKTGVSNLLYANVPVRMSDVSRDDDIIAETTAVVRPVSEDYLSEEELIDGELTVEPESMGGEVDSTYYNVAGKRVAIAKLSEYIRTKSRDDIKEDFQKIPKGLLKDYKEAKKAKNVAKNKYRFIYPYDESRVVLYDGGSDYMNASYIEGYKKSKEYIASSGPFKKSYDTTPDFWRMIWQEKCENIVMLTNPTENGQTKCETYWPEPGASKDFGALHVTCLTEDRYSDFTIRIFTVTQDNNSLNIRHLHFTAWPDKGVPHDVTSMIEFRQKVRSLHKDKDCPMLVHCSAGIGRTGTFIALDMLTYEGEDRGSVDIFGCISALRSQRCNMVQTDDQYDYLHYAVLHSLTFDCRSIPGDVFLQNYNKLIEKNGGTRIIDNQFQQLQSITDEMSDEDKAEVTRHESMRNKNRHGADVPGDEYRVKLHENRKPGASDYINAVYINGFRRRHKFIVAQTPLPSTVVDFLSLIHQEKCSCVVMMDEADITNKTLGVYWPADNQIIKHGVFKVSRKESKTTPHYTMKTLSLISHGPKGEEEHDVHLFIFTNWPKDCVVPKTSDSVLQLVKVVDGVNRRSDKESPILIHCMTGSERSCLYCAVSVLIEKMEIEHEVSVVNTLRQIKARRRSAFPSVEQYKFCHEAVISYLQSFDIYSNFGLKESEDSTV